MAQERRHVEQLFERFRSNDAGIPQQGIDHSIARGQGPGMR